MENLNDYQKQYVEEKSFLHQAIIDYLVNKEDYCFWLIIGAIEAALAFKEKDLLPYLSDFDRLMETLLTCYEHDIENLIEVCGDEDALDLVEWHNCIKKINKELHINKQELDRKGKHFLFIIAILCK